MFSKFPWIRRPALYVNFTEIYDVAFTVNQFCRSQIFNNTDSEPKVKKKRHTVPNKKEKEKKPGGKNTLFKRQKGVKPENQKRNFISVKLKLITILAALILREQHQTYEDSCAGESPVAQKSK